MKFFLSSLLVLTLASCSSTKKERELEEKEHENLKKDYKVRDASSSVRPGWVEDAQLWAKEYGKDTGKFRFFSFETEPKVSRSMACHIAKANARADIASEVATFIDKELAATTEGQGSIDENNPYPQPLQEYVENTLAEKIRGKIHGASVLKQYWEKRAYLKDEGAKKNYMAYTCAALIRMPNSRLSKAIDDAANLVARQAKEASRAQIKEVLKKASQNFKQ